MSLLQHLGVAVTGVKCFRTSQGFERLLPLNVIVGRNNSGKSSLLDILESLCTTDNDSHSYRLSNALEYQYSLAITREVADSYLARYGGTEQDRTVRESLAQLKDATIRWTFSVARRTDNHATATAQVSQLPWGVDQSTLDDAAKALVRINPSPLEGFIFRRLVADRDIWREVEQADTQLLRNGGRATDLIQQYLNDSHRHRDLIENDLVEAFNQIAHPDIRLRRLIAQRVSGNREWELFLDEAKKGRIPISASGSGIKTILLVLLNIHIAPALLSGNPHPNHSQLIIAIEEPENNLHPHLQRRLLRYLSQWARDRGATFLITTHSSIALDLLAPEPTTQVIHLMHDGDGAHAVVANSRQETRSILDGLGVRASDLLQANCLIWVEGPSDRIYVKHWIELWSGNTVREHEHYEFALYGGAVLANFSFEDNDGPPDELVHAIRINRNAIVVMDSDKRDTTVELKGRVKRVAAEVSQIGGLPWITDGREIENYIPSDTLRLFAPKATESDSPSKHLSVFDWISQNGGAKLEGRKVELARKVIESTPRMDQWSGILDLSDRIPAVCDAIKRWNAIEGCA